MKLLLIVTVCIMILFIFCALKLASTTDNMMTRKIDESEEKSELI